MVVDVDDRVKVAFEGGALFGVCSLEPSRLAHTRPPAHQPVHKRDVIGHGRDYLLIASVTLAAYPILFVTVFAMQGIKKTAYGLWVGIYRQIVAPIIVFNALAFGLGWGLWGVWWGISFVTWSAALFALGWGAVRIGRSGTVSGPGNTDPPG